MKLTDEEILELSELCSAVIDQRLTDVQRNRLSAWLAASEEARRYYVRAMGQSASLHSYASEMHAEAAPARPLTSWRWLGIGGSLAAAAALVIMFFLGRSTHVVANPPPRPPVLVARVSALKDAEWRGKSFAPGTQLAKGQQLELAGGYAEITFDSGARLILEAPAQLTVNSAWDSTLRTGTLKAIVPPQAIGFRISNPSVEVVDLGTEFTMIAGSDGSTEVLVLKGEVEAAPRVTKSQEQDVLLLRENESRRFAESGVTSVADHDGKIARFSQSVTLDRYAPSYRYAHWSFDESNQLSARFVDADGTDRTLATTLTSETNSPAIVDGGRWNNALTLNGSHFLNTSFPGLSGDTPHTIAFWVRVPQNAPLSEAYSILGWRSSVSKLNYRPVHISWNRNPQEGALGAIRTDFAGGCAIGSSSLRDGRWHHIAIVFSPGTNNSPVHVKQYVDGFLESSTIIPGRTRGPVAKPFAQLDDQLWIGSRIGSTGPRQERFRGEIDELFIADGSLEPQEIVQLQRENRIGQPMEPLIATTEP
jgi:ferric-dicitrate binding protein FerR (iron transport regulator)